MIEQYKEILIDTHFETDTKIETLLENSISIWFQKDTEPFEVLMYADKVATKYFKRRPLPNQQIETLSENGTMEFAVRVTHEMEILPIIKYWLPNLKVIKPQWLQDTLDKELKSYIEINYKDTHI